MWVDKNVRDMQKAGFWEANIHKSGLHPGQNFHHTSAVDVTNETMIGMALDEQFSHDTLFKQRDTRLTWGGIHNNVTQYLTPQAE
jgi:hypothetical protein